MVGVDISPGMILQAERDRGPTMRWKSPTSSRFSRLSRPNPPISSSPPTCSSISAISRRSSACARARFGARRALGVLARVARRRSLSARPRRCASNIRSADVRDALAGSGLEAIFDRGAIARGARRGSTLSAGGSLWSAPHGRRARMIAALSSPPKTKIAAIEYRNTSAIIDIGEAGIGRDVVARKFAEIDAERFAESDAADESHRDARRYVEQAQPSCAASHDGRASSAISKRQRRYAESHEGDDIVQRRQSRRDAHDGRPDQRPQHDQKGEREQRQRAKRDMRPIDCSRSSHHGRVSTKS